MIIHFAKRVAQARIESGLTQKELAKCFNKTPQTIKLVEKGSSLLKFESFLNLCDVLNKPPSFFLQDDCRQAKIENIMYMINSINSLNETQLVLLRETLNTIINI